MDSQTEKTLLREWLDKGIPKIEMARRLNIARATLEKRFDKYGFIIPKKEVKFKFDRNQSVYGYLIEHNYTKKDYCRVYWLMKNKCMTLDEALNFHRQLGRQEKDYKEEKRLAWRKKYGYTAEQLNLPTEEIRKLGIMKYTKYKYNGKPLREYCKDKGYNYRQVVSMYKRFKIQIWEALKFYKQGLRAKDLRKQGCTHREKKI